MNVNRADVVVVGSGIAGFAAAMSVAQNKKKVILVDRLPEIGGASVNSNVGTICGAYYRSFTKQKVAGNSFSVFMLDKLLGCPGIGKPYMHQDGLYIIPYEWSALRDFYRKHLSDSKVEVHLNCKLDHVLIKGNRINELGFNDGSTKILADAVVDCSGNAIISQLAGLDTIKDKSYQAASQVFRLKSVDSLDEYALNFALKKSILKNETQERWPPSHRSLSVVPGSLRNNVVDLKFVLPEVITDQTELTVLGKNAADAIENLVPILKKEIKNLEYATIESIFPLPGYRVLQRSKGKYVLNESDVLACKKSDQGIATGTWPIEEWSNDGILRMEFFAPDDGYHIPADCLRPAQIENLFFAGRNISATSKAMASARVMGTAWQTGYAAGKLSCAKNEPEIQTMIELLHRELQ